MEHVTGFVVTLEKDVSAEFGERLRQALAMMRGVISVEPVMADFDHHMAREQARWDVEKKVLEALRQK